MIGDHGTRVGNQKYTPLYKMELRFLLPYESQQKKLDAAGALNT